MNPEEFRVHGHQLVDWMADYLSGVEQFPVRAQVAPGEIAAKLPLNPPEQGEDFTTIFRDFQDIIMPGMTHWQHPNFFAYFPANSSPPSVLAEMLTATVAAQCMLWQTSPAATELENRVLSWLQQLLGLPADWSGVIQDSASSATLCAVLAARERATGWQINEQGLSEGPAVVFYASDQAHSSIEKAITIAGIGRQHLRKVPRRADQSMDPRQLLAMVQSDRQAGRIPAGVVACLGTTGTGVVDCLDEIGPICRAENLYLHVDAAWAGSALLLPEQRWMSTGMDLADSFVVNPHKWLLTNFDCSTHYVRDAETLVRTLSILPAYLRSRETGTVTDYRDWSVPLGRRFRALKLWFVLRSYGAEALREMIRRHIAYAAELAEWIAASDGFEVMDGPRLSLLNFRFAPPAVSTAEDLDRLNRRLVEAINDDGRVYLTPNTIDGRASIRFSIGQLYTQRHHVERGWDVVKSVAQSVLTAFLSEQDTPST